jgi:hypothetical protein
MAEPTTVEEVVVTGKRKKPNFAVRAARTAGLAVRDPSAFVKGAKELPGAVVRGVKTYARTHTPQQFGADVVRTGKNIVSDVVEHPVQTVLGALPLVGGAMSAIDTAKARESAADARARGDERTAQMYEQIAAASAGTILAGMIPGGRTVAKGLVKEGEQAAVKEAEKLAARYGVEVPKVRRDNPGGDWLKYQREGAEERKPLGSAGVSGALTGYLDKPVLLDPAKVTRLPGAMNEKPGPGKAQYDALMKSIREKGFLEEESGPILIGVNHRGEPYILEGNNRARVMSDLGHKAIPAEVRWFAGGEQVPGALSPDKLADYAYRPAPAAQDLGARYGLPEFTTDLTPAQIEANLASFLEGSKAPEKLYHGTTEWSGTAYDPARPSANRAGNNVAGFYADERPSRAEGYTVDWRKNENEPAEGSQILPVHMAIRNPFVPGRTPVNQEMLATYADELRRANKHLAGGYADDWIASKVNDMARSNSVSVGALNGDGMAYQRVLRAGGYDGLKDGSAWVAFEPTQIKSTMNRGTFDPNEPHLNKAMGGLIEKYAEGGPVAPGNIDLHNRPVVHNPDGSISTVRSITVGFGDKTYVLPTVVGGKVVSNREAIDHFRQTGEHLGAYDKQKDAEDYSQRLHEEQAKEYKDKARGGLVEKYGV